MYFHNVPFSQRSSIPKQARRWLYIYCPDHPAWNLLGALALENKSVILASYMQGVFNAQAYGIWTMLYPDYKCLIGGIGGLIGVIVLLPVALYYLRKW